MSDYDAALQKIGTLIHSQTRPEGKSWEDDFNQLHVSVEQLGLTEELKQLSIIHVAGTKGKGSTCAFAESILRTGGCSTGLFTSPHLIDIRERFRLNGEPISEEKFLESFWVVWDKLQAAVTAEHGMPAYFRFLTLLGLHIFVSQKVDVLVLEVGLGGRLDATNVVPAPRVCGVSSLGLDHTEVLGNTLSLIAGEKAGIFKSGVPAFTAPQEEEAMQSLQAKADALKIPLKVSPPLETYTLDPSAVEKNCLDSSTQLNLGLQGTHQRLNAALAVSLVGCWLARHPDPASLPLDLNQAKDMLQQHPPALSPAFILGLANARWPGRAQILPDPEVVPPPDAGGNGKEGGGDAAMVSPLTYYLDGAHTEDSMASCAHWFTTEVDKMQPKDGEEYWRVLVFNCMEKRDPKLLLDPFARVCQEKELKFAKTIFVPPDSGVSIKPSLGDKKDVRWQSTLKQTWDSIQQGSSKKRELGSEEVKGGSGGVGGGLSSGPSSAVTSSASCSLNSTVMPSVTATIDFLRQTARDNPNRRLQVLVTGSLYLVGDVLRTVRRGVPL